MTTRDLAILLSVLGQPATVSGRADAADLDHSGRVTAADFAYLRKALGTAP